jgi:hypothetical protein
VYCPIGLANNKGTLIDSFFSDIMKYNSTSGCPFNTQIVDIG